MAEFTAEDLKVLQKLKETEAFWQQHNGYRALEIVPFSDEDKLKFHKYMKDLAQKLLGEGVNLDDENLVFMLSENKQPNAAFVHEKEGKHNFIFVSTGLFDLCENKDQFAFVLGHELQHFLENRKHPDAHNTKLEETYADLNAVPKLARAGLNIRQAGVMANKIFDKKIVNLADIVNEHGTDVNRVKSIDMTILATKNYLARKGITSPEIIGDEVHPYEEDFKELLAGRPKQKSLRDFFKSEEYTSASYQEKVAMWFDKLNDSIYLEQDGTEQRYKIDEVAQKVLIEERHKLYEANSRHTVDYDYCFEKTFFDTLFKDISDPKALKQKGSIFFNVSQIPELGKSVGFFEYDDIKDYFRRYFENTREIETEREAVLFYTKLLVMRDATPEYFFHNFCYHENLFNLDHQSDAEVGKNFPKILMEPNRRFRRIMAAFFDANYLDNGDVILRDGGLYFGMDKEGKIKFVDKSLDRIEARFVAEQINEIVHNLHDVRAGQEMEDYEKVETLVKAWRLCLPARLNKRDFRSENVYADANTFDFWKLERFKTEGGINVCLIEEYLSEEAKQFWDEKENYQNNPDGAWFKYITEALEKEIKRDPVNIDVYGLLYAFEDNNNVAELRTEECERLLKARHEANPKDSLSHADRKVADIKFLRHLEAGKSIDDFQFPFEEYYEAKYKGAINSGDAANPFFMSYYRYKMLKKDADIDLGQIYAREKKEVTNSLGASFSVLPLLGLPPSWKFGRAGKYEHPEYCQQILERYHHNISNPKNWGDGTIHPGALDMPFVERFYYLMKNMKQGFNGDAIDVHHFSDIALHFYREASIDDKIQFMAPALGYTVPNKGRDGIRAKFSASIREDLSNKEISLQKRLDLFCTLYQNDVFMGDYKDYFAVLVGKDGKGGLLKEIAEQPAPKTALYLQLLQKENRIVDPDIRRQVVSLACQTWLEEHGSYNDITATPEQRAQFIKDVEELKLTFKGEITPPSGDEFFDQFFGDMAKRNLPENDARQFLSELAERTVSQLEVCRAIEPEPKELDTQDKSMIAAAYGVDTLTYLLEQKIINRESTIDFFLGDGSYDKAFEFSYQLGQDLQHNKFIGAISDDSVAIYQSKLTPEAVLMMKKEFDAAPLEVKAAMINMLTSGNDWENNFNQVADKLFANSGELGEIGKKFLKSYIGSRDQSERCFYLSAIYTAANNKSTVAFDDGTSPYTPEQRSLAQGLRLFLENSGPAGVKLAQAMSSYTDVPEFIRDEMQKAKNNANPPDRWTVFDWLEDAKQMDLLKVGKLGKRIGSASFFVTYTMLGEKGNKLVAKILRGGSKFAADEEFKIYKQMMNKMQKDFKWLSAFERLIDNAASMVDVETDLKIGLDQLEHAKTLYPDKAKADNVEFNIKVMDWTSHDEIWAVMHMADGKDYADLSHPYKKAAAKAIFVTELANMLSGKRFDSDRHAGQYKIDEKTNTIGVFDTGSISVVEPTDKEKEVLGIVLANTMKLLMDSSDTDVAVVLCNEIDKGIEKHYAEEIKSGKSVPPYLSEFQRGLLALTDFHKEIPPKELAVCLMQALNNGKQKLDPVIYKGFAETMFDGQADKQLLSAKDTAEMVTSILSGAEKASVMTKEAKEAQSFGRIAAATVIENDDIYGALTHLPEQVKDEKILDVLSSNGGKIQFSKGVMKELFARIDPKNYSAEEKKQVGVVLYQVVKQVSYKKKLHQPYSVLQIFEEAAKTSPEGKYVQNMKAIAGLAAKFGMDIDAANFQRGVILGQLLDKDVEKGYRAALNADNEASMFKKALSKVDPLRFVPRQYARRMVKYAMKHMAPKCAAFIEHQLAGKDVSTTSRAESQQH